MGPRRSPRTTTLARLMILIAVFALLLAVYRLGVTGLAEHALLFGAAWAFLLLVLVVNAVLDRTLGIRCPCCLRYALRRLALPFSFVAYYECTACRSRLKRHYWPFTPWRDASGPEDAANYRRRPKARWLAYTVPEVSDLMTGTLLRSKRSRAASGPEKEGRVESGA